MIGKADLEFELPPDRIAQYPVHPRDAARLLVVDRATGALAERRFSELPEALEPDDLVVVNDTRVLPARLRGSKASGGKAEALLIERSKCSPGYPARSRPRPPRFTSRPSWPRACG